MILKRYEIVDELFRAAKDFSETSCEEVKSSKAFSPSENFGKWVWVPLVHLTYYECEDVYAKHDHTFDWACPSHDIQRRHFKEFAYSIYRKGLIYLLRIKTDLFTKGLSPGTPWMDSAKRSEKGRKLGNLDTLCDGAPWWSSLVKRRSDVESWIDAVLYW